MAANPDTEIVGVVVVFVALNFTRSLLLVVSAVNAGDGVRVYAVVLPAVVNAVNVCV